MSYEAQLEEQKKLLAELQSRYTDKHPDIVRVKKRIADLEKSKETTSVKNDPRYKELNASLAETDRQIRRLRQEGEKISAHVGQYRGRIEGATQREQEMAAMLQEYHNTRLLYDTLIKKSEEAQQAENLERRQKGEQFRVIDPARMPEKPVQPDIPKVLLIGLFAGLGCGLGGIFIREQLDRSFRDPEDAEVTLGLKVLANIPRIGSKAA
jgi:succinoglycan biosynthesis transport protein ExoP